MKFKIAVVFLGSMILLAMVTLVVLVGVSYTGKDCPEAMVETRYQCADGRFVASISECPTVLEPLTTTVKKSTSTDTAGKQTTSTTTMCPCTPGLTTLYTSSTTMWQGPSCETDLDCGTVTEGDIKCISGDAHVLVNTPQCKENHCITLISSKLKQVCGRNDICQKGVGCVPSED